MPDEITPYTEVLEGEVLSENQLAAPDMMDAFEWFLQIDVASGDATSDTVNAYRREVGAWLAWCDDHGLEPLNITRNDVALFREELKNRGMEVSTRGFKLSIIRRFYDACLRHNLVSYNPATGLKAGKNLTAPEDKMKVLGRRELVKLFDGMTVETIADARDKAIMGLMALHGLRRIEVHRLDKSHLKNRDGDAPYLEIHGKGGKTRLAYLRADVLASLETYLHAKFEAGLSDDGAIFVSHSNNARGKRLSRQALNEIADKHLVLAGIKRDGVSCHALRHTFGTLAVAGGAKIEHLRDAMGHSSIQTTSLYVRAVDKVKNNPANLIDVEL